jgi:hypothetical protein
LFLILILQGTVISELTPEMKNKITKIAKLLNFAKKVNERKMRKLEGTDESDGEAGSNSTSVPPEAGTYTGDTGATGAETAKATAQDANVNPNKPVSEKGYNKNQKGKKIQISKFFNFKGEPGDSQMSFNMLFLFLRSIPYRVIFRLRVLYTSRLRNLEETGQAQSVRSDCVLTNETLEGQTLDKNINFDCTANKTKGKEIANVTLNTDTGIALASKDGTILEETTFDDVNFNGNAADEALSINEREENIKTFGDLLANKADVSFESNVLKIKGKLEKTDLSSSLRGLNFDDGKFNMHFEDGSTSGDYECTLSESGDTAELECPISGSSINPTYNDIDSSQGNTTNGDNSIDLLNVHIDEPTDDKINPSSGSAYYKKSSSGLSGGAIAGIVIACVVVLVAAAIAAIMLRKPSPPVDNTTVAELKTDNI